MKIIFGGIVLSVLFSFAAMAEETLPQKIERLEKDLNSLQRQFYQGVKVNDGSYTEGNLKRVSSPEKNASKKEVVGKLDVLSPSDHLEIKVAELESLISALTNEVERLRYDFNVLNAKLDRMNTDTSLRFAQLEEKEVAPLVSSSVAAPASSQKLYDDAYAYIKVADYPKAEQMFQEFLDKYPKDALSGNASYWLGESFYARNNYAKAAVIFAQGYKNYPNSNKAPDSFLKLGLAMKALKKNSEACTVFVNFDKEYSKAAQSLKNRAKKEVGALSCK